MRWFYTIYQFIKHYKELKHIAKNNECHNVTNIDADFIEREKIQTLVLDFDGVLAYHGAKQIDADVFTWLKNICDNMPSLQIYILSNKPLLVRQQYFKKHFPRVKFIIATRKKPYPCGLLSVLEDSKSLAVNTCIVDDRLATGVLAAIIAKIKVCYIFPPRSQRNLVERFFLILRSIERTLVGI